MTNQLPASLSAKQPAWKERLTVEDKPGWYECEPKHTAGDRIVFWWTGSMLIKRPGYREQMHLDSYTNFRGPLTQEQ